MPQFAGCRLDRSRPGLRCAAADGFGCRQAESNGDIKRFRTVSGKRSQGSPALLWVGPLPVD